MTYACSVAPGDLVFYLDPIDNDPGLLRCGRCVGTGAHSQSPIVYLMGGNWIFRCEIVRIERGPASAKPRKGKACV